MHHEERDGVPLLLFITIFCGDCRVADVAGSQADGLIDEVDCSMDTLGVGVFHDAGVGGVDVIGVGKLGLPSEETGGLSNRARTAFEVDVLAGERLMKLNRRRKALEITLPEGDGLAPYENDPVLSNCRLKQPEYATHLLQLERSVGGHPALSLGTSLRLG